jgi:hypothetical protein
VGAHTSNGDGQLVRVRSVTRHPRFNTNKWAKEEYDVSIIKLEEPLRWSSKESHTFIPHVL